MVGDGTTRLRSVVGLFRLIRHRGSYANNKRLQRKFEDFCFVQNIPREDRRTRRPWTNVFATCARKNARTRRTWHKPHTYTTNMCATDVQTLFPDPKPWLRPWRQQVRPGVEQTKRSAKPVNKAVANNRKTISVRKRGNVVDSPRVSYRL